MALFFDQIIPYPHHTVLNRPNFKKMNAKCFLSEKNAPSQADQKATLGKQVVISYLTGLFPSFNLEGGRHDRHIWKNEFLDSSEIHVCRNPSPYSSRLFHPMVLTAWCALVELCSCYFVPKQRWGLLNCYMQQSSVFLFKPFYSKIWAVFESGGLRSAQAL